jgi:hypothetical protein
VIRRRCERWRPTATASPGSTSGTTQVVHKDAFGESSIGAIFVVLAIAGIQLQLPDTVTVGPFWLIPAIEVLGAPGLLMVLKAAGTPGRALRTGLYAYLIFLVAASVLNAMLLLRSLLDDTEESGKILLFAGFGVLFINVLSFALVYWQLDGGGPKARRSKPLGRPDFLLPQQDKYRNGSRRSPTTCSPPIRTSSPSARRTRCR